MVRLVELSTSVFVASFFAAHRVHAEGRGDGGNGRGDGRGSGLIQTCEMSDWTPWEACGVNGYRTRTRDIIKSSSKDGTPCPATHDLQKCDIGDWLMDAWGDWVCDANSGMKSRTRTVFRSGRPGRKCPELVQTTACDPVPCVVNSISEDSGEWGACQWNALSRRWVRSKVLGIKAPAQYGGVCPPDTASSRRVRQTCPPVNCVVNTVEEDNGAWSVCTDQGNGRWTKSKVLDIKTPALYGGSCPSTTSPERKATETCSPLDCVLNSAEEEPTAWSVCKPGDDGKWYRTKVLGVKTPQKFGGSCPSTDNDKRIARELCEPIDCVVNSEEEDGGSWDPCQPDKSGQWFQKKVLGIKSPEQYGGFCPSDSERTASKLCPAVDCKINSEDEDTGTWDACQDNGSGQWFRKKVLGVKTPEIYGGSCPASNHPSRLATQLCEPQDCEINSEEEDTGNWDACQDNGKGQWFQKKVLGVKTPELYGGACPSPSSPARIVTMPCEPVNCVLNSVDEDTGTWDACQDNGSGQWFQKKVLGVKTPELYGGSCPSPSDAERLATKRCEPVNCVLNSVDEDTGNWDACQDNGNGMWFQKKVLGVKTPELYGGSCPSTTHPDRIVSKFCPPVNCVIKTPAEDNGPFSTCSRGVYWNKKYKVKVLAIKVPAQYGGTPCPPTSARLIKKYCGFLEYLDMLREYESFVLTCDNTQIKEGLPFFTASQTSGGVNFGPMLPYNPAKPTAVTFTGATPCGTGANATKRKLSVTLVCGAEMKLRPLVRKSTCEWTATLEMPVKEVCPTLGPAL